MRRGAEFDRPKTPLPARRPKVDRYDSDVLPIAAALEKWAGAMIAAVTARQAATEEAANLMVDESFLNV